MNRIIKFRAWSNEGLRFWYFDYTSGFNAENNDCFSHPMQFTGLTDKNGKDIYEDDVLYCMKAYYKLFKHENGCYELHEKGNDKVFILQQVLHHVEIIGNIHSNPELLK